MKGKKKIIGLAALLVLGLASCANYPTMNAKVTNSQDYHPFSITTRKKAERQIQGLANEDKEEEAFISYPIPKSDKIVLLDVGSAQTETNLKIDLEDILRRMMLVSKREKTVVPFNFYHTHPDNSIKNVMMDFCKKGWCRAPRGTSYLFPKNSNPRYDRELIYEIASGPSFSDISLAIEIEKCSRKYGQKFIDSRIITGRGMFIYKATDELVDRYSDYLDTTPKPIFDLDIKNSQNPIQQLHTISIIKGFESQNLENTLNSYRRKGLDIKYVRFE